MLEKIVILYRKAEMGFVSELSGVTTEVINETRFYDTGYMQTQISRIQKELRHIESELKISLEVQDNSDYGKNHVSEMMEQREKLMFHLIFLASNSFGNLDDCMKMARGHNFIFMQCVQGLQEYHAGHNDKAFNLIEAYYRKHGSVEEHFLVNKVFGLLLADKKQYKKAVPFLTYALQFMPDDIECLNCLKLCYQMENQDDRGAVVGEILSVLY